MKALLDLHGFKRMMDIPSRQGRLDIPFKSVIEGIVNEDTFVKRSNGMGMKVAFFLVGEEYLLGEPILLYEGKFA